MGTRSLLAIINKYKRCQKLQDFINQFCIWRYYQYDGFFEHKGLEYAKFLCQLVKSNQWDEFVGYLNNIQNVDEPEKAFPEYDKETFSTLEDAYQDLKCSAYCYDYLYKNLNNINESDGFWKKFPKYKHFWPTLDDLLAFERRYYPLSISCDILKLIMERKGEFVTDQCSPEWPADFLFCEFAYVIDVQNKKYYALSNGQRAKSGDILHQLSRFIYKPVLGSVKCFDIDENLEKKFEDFLKSLKHTHEKEDEKEDEDEKEEINEEDKEDDQKNQD